MFPYPGLPVVDLQLPDQGIIAVAAQGDGEVAFPEACLTLADRRSPGRTAPGKLDIVVKDEDIRSVDLVEVAQPGEVVGLVDGDS